MLERLKNTLKLKFFRGMEEGDITREEMKKMSKEGAILIDVRSPQEFKEGHLDGAICIPEYDIKKDIENRIPNKKQKIIVYCSTGSRSKRARKKLLNKGYENVYNLYDGMENYL